MAARAGIEERKSNKNRKTEEKWIREQSAAGRKKATDES
jgi:hypothetical protein